jgi:hypothetical protein
VIGPSSLVRCRVRSSGQRLSLTPSPGRPSPGDPHHVEEFVKTAEAGDSVLAAAVEYRRGGSLGILDQGALAKVPAPDVPRARPGRKRWTRQSHTAEALTVSAYDQAIRAAFAPDQAREQVREE